MEQCKGCRFWLNWDSEQTNLGECHRFPPRMATAFRDDVNEEPAATIRPQDGGWPLTSPDDWCGEFQSMPTPAAPADETRPASSQGSPDVGAAGI